MTTANKRRAFANLVAATTSPTTPWNLKPSAAINAYLRAPRGTFDINARWPQAMFTPRQHLERLAASGDFPQLSRWFHRVPKKRNLVRRTGPVPQWSTEVYRNIQQVRRTPNRIPATTNYTKARRNSAWLERYMTRHALRAPALPLRAPRTPLFRGAMLTPAQLARLTSTGEWSDKGFMAFSRDQGHACFFGSRPGRASHFVLFRLRLEDVARGTPWIWYTAEDDNRNNNDDRLPDKPVDGWDLHLNPTEQEVLLPPGTLRVKRYRMHDQDSDECNLTNGYASPLWFEVDASFVPEPQFAPKPRRKGTRESNDNTLWDIFAGDAVTRKRARSEQAAANSRPKTRLPWPSWLRRA